jgi:hypothetical protein
MPCRSHFPIDLVVTRGQILGDAMKNFRRVENPPGSRVQVSRVRVRVEFESPVQNP